MKEQLRFKVLEPKDLDEVNVSRLKNILITMRIHHRKLNQGGIELMNKAIFSAYADCLDSGKKDAADVLVKTMVTS